MTGITRCIPCQQHTEDFASYYEISLPYHLTDDEAVARLYSLACDTTGNPVTIHKGPVLDFSGRRWAVTVP